MANINVTPEQVRTLGTSCKTQSDAIGTLIKAVEGQINSTQWESPAATRFHGDWATHKSNLHTLQRELDELGNAAKTMATNYEHADQAYQG